MKLFDCVAVCSISFSCCCLAEVYKLKLQQIHVEKSEKFSPLAEILFMRNSSRQRLTNYGNWLYVANVSFGTPKQRFRVLMDTGSVLLWVPDITAKGTVVRKIRKDSDNRVLVPAGDHKFDSSKSTTYKKDGRRLEADYGAGGASGFFGEDNFCFHEGLCTEMTFGQANKFWDRLPDKRFDGICGLAFKGFAQYHITPPFERVMNSLDKPIFSFWAGTTLTPSKTAGGEIVFGAEDPDHCEPVTDWVPIIKTPWDGEMVWGFWRYRVDSVSINGKVLGQSMTALSDTGGPICGGPDDQVQELAKTVGAKRLAEPDEFQYSIDCDATPPDIVFKINGNDYPITYHKYITKDLKGSPTCYFGVVGGNPPGSWYMGDTFIRQFCHVHDQKNRVIAFAKSKF